MLYEPPYTERYVRWCEGTVDKLIIYLLLDSIGDGPEKKNLEALIQKFTLKKNINFLGFLENHNDVYALMKSSKVFVLPLTREEFGIVVIKANACGKTVITIDHKDNADRFLIEEGRSGFVYQLDENEIAKKIIEF